MTWSRRQCSPRRETETRSITTDDPDACRIEHARNIDEPAGHQCLPARAIDVECAADELDVTTETRAGTPCEQFVAELELLLGGPNVGRT